MLVDQTWVVNWGGFVSDQQSVKMAKWVASKKEAIVKLALRFPPYCLVRSTRKLTQLTERDLNLVPFPGTLGFVAGYGGCGKKVFVRQSPDKNAVAVPVETLEYVRSWGGLTPDFLRGFLAMAAEKPSSSVWRKLHESFRGPSSKLRERHSWSWGFA